MARQLGLSKDNFIGLVECTFKLSAILKNKNNISIFLRIMIAEANF